MKNPKVISNNFCHYLLLGFVVILGIITIVASGGGGGEEEASTDNNDVNTSGQWTWVSGDSMVDQTGIYGTKGVGSTSNKPGGRNGSISWIDSSDNIWMFGGSGFNDLWKFEPSTGEWTWISGDNTEGQLGVYGTKGTGLTSNKPGGRSGSISWIDSSENLWLFGGYGYDSSGNNGSLNDLWKFEPSTGEWTWVSGGNIEGQLGIYGTKGTGSTSNKPGGRSGSISWIDSSGNLWLFGGGGFAASFERFGSLNDLWKFEPSTGEWTWVSGDNTYDERGVYGEKGKASTSNKPGARGGGSISWIDSSDNLWLFGGYGFDASGNNGRLNDLWKYEP